MTDFLSSDSNLVLFSQTETHDLRRSEKHELKCHDTLNLFLAGCDP